MESAIVCSQFPDMDVPGDLSNGHTSRELQEAALISQKDELEDELCAKMDKYPKFQGPICQAISACLESFNIVRQAYHSNSFVGNHCHKYLTEDVIKSLTQIVRQTAIQSTNHKTIIANAFRISQTAEAVLLQYSKAHSLMAHKRPIPIDDIESIECEIKNILSSVGGNEKYKSQENFSS